MKFCIVLVSIMFIISYSSLGRQFICVVRIGLISGLVLVMVVKWWLNNMCLLVGMQFRLLLLIIVGVVWVGFSCIILLVMNRLQKWQVIRYSEIVVMMIYSVLMCLSWCRVMVFRQKVLSRVRVVQFILENFFMRCFFLERQLKSFVCF